MGWFLRRSGLLASFWVLGLVFQKNPPMKSINSHQPPELGANCKLGLFVWNKSQHAKILSGIGIDFQGQPGKLNMTIKKPNRFEDVYISSLK